MKRSSIVLVIFAGFSLLILLSILGCGASSNSSTPTSKALRYVNVIPSSVTGLYIGTSENFTAIAVYSDSSSTNVTTTASWTVSSEVGIISKGLFTAEGVGTGTVKAIYQNVYGYATVTISSTTEPVNTDIVSIEVSAGTSEIVVNIALAFQATGYTTAGVATSFNPEWSISDTAIGTIDSSSGVFYSSDEGTANVYATTGEVQGTYEVTVAGYIIVITTEADIYVASNTPDSNKINDVSIRAGYVSDTGVTYWGFLSFEVNDNTIPATRAVQAVTITMEASSGLGTLVVSRVESPWSDSTVTYTSAQAFSIGTDLASINGASGLVQAIPKGDAFKTFVNLWRTGEVENYGMVIRSEISGYLSFSSVRDTYARSPAYLTVYYK